MGETDDVLDIYFDSIEVSVTLVGVNMTFGLRPPHPPKPDEPVPPSKPLLVARTGLKHAKILAMLLTKQLKHYERETGDIISFPQELYEALGLNRSDW